LEDKWDRIITGQATGVPASVVRAGLRLGAAAYAGGLAANHFVYDSGLRQRTRPALPVISVGNLSLGGTGKTTAAAFIARLLLPHAKPAIVLRGYRRREVAGPLIVADGRHTRAMLSEAGDEALMLARQLPGCAVGVGKRRERVIEQLKAQTGAQVAILDDGLQYFRMRRSVEIVLLDALSNFASWRLFPAGRLREPVSGLARATQVWITHADIAPPRRVRTLEDVAANSAPEALVVRTRHRPGPLRPITAGQQVPDSIRDMKVVALSALGNPEAFELALTDLGAHVQPLRFPDHHAYAAGDYDAVRACARSYGAEVIVTTEKDAVKLPEPPADLPPVAVMGCDLQILDHAQDAQQQLIQVVERPCAD